MTASKTKQSPTRRAAKAKSPAPFELRRCPQGRQAVERECDRRGARCRPPSGARSSRCTGPAQAAGRSKADCEAQVPLGGFRQGAAGWREPRLHAKLAKKHLATIAELVRLRLQPLPAVEVCASEVTVRQQRQQIEFGGNGARARNHSLAGFKIVSARGMDRRRQPAGVGFCRAFAEAPCSLQQIGQRLQALSNSPASTSAST